ncbi:uncharacterized protein LOC135503074 [Lineus longissimus]|uniref:uncharacterized protein LOC135485020 n=1 Tax=Lineus longissimus TaxID=88925 RepID=UPI00315DDB53
MGRKPNFSDAEKIRLIEAYDARKGLLVGKFSSNVSSRRKHDAWLEITDNVNSRNPHVVREMTELQKKWQNLTSAMKDEYREYKKALGKTGGGPPPKEPSIISQKVAAVIGEDDPSVYGIDGGFDSGAPKPKIATSVNTVPRLNITHSVATNDSSFSENEEENQTESFLQEPKMRTQKRKASSSLGCASAALASTSTKFQRLVQPSPVRSSLPNPCPPLPKNTEKDKTLKNLGNTDEMVVLQKELLASEKERCALEMDKLKLEKEKLVLEIKLLKMKTSKMEKEMENASVNSFQANDENIFTQL